MVVVVVVVFWVVVTLGGWLYQYTFKANTSTNAASNIFMILFFFKSNRFYLYCNTVTMEIVHVHATPLKTSNKPNHILPIRVFGFKRRDGKVRKGAEKEE